MEEVCKKLELNWDDECLDWMHKAVEHCGQVMQQYKTPDSDLWTAMRSAFVPDKLDNGLISGMKIEPDTNPFNLDFGECSELLTTIAGDYLGRLPYIQNMEVMSIGMWTTLFGAMGVILMVGLLYLGTFCKRKLVGCNSWQMIRGPTHNEYKNLDSSFLNGQCGHVKESGPRTVVIKVLNAVDDEVCKSLGSFEPESVNDYSKELPYKRATVEEVLNFLDNHRARLKLILSFDDEKIYDEVTKRCVLAHFGEKLPSIYPRSPSQISIFNGTPSRSRIPVASKPSGPIWKGENLK